MAKVPTKWGQNGRKTERRKVKKVKIPLSVLAPAFGDARAKNMGLSRVAIKWPKYRIV